MRKHSLFFSSSQQTKFNHYFQQIQQQYWELLGSDYIGTIRRLGLTAFGIAMVIKTLRIMDTRTINDTMVCSYIDFYFTIEVTKVLLQCNAFVFRQLPRAATDNSKMALFQSLPVLFDRTKYIEPAAQLQIPESTADKQIAPFLNTGLPIKLAHGSYAKKEGYKHVQ